MSTENRPNLLDILNSVPLPSPNSDDQAGLNNQSENQGQPHGPISPPFDFQIPTTLWSGDQVASAFKEQLLNGQFEKLYPQKPGFERLEIGPGQLTILGAHPNAGKTALASQLMFDTLELQPDLRVVVVNGEMHAKVLVSRELVRRSGIKGSHLRFGLQSQAELDRACEFLDRIGSQLKNCQFETEPCLDSIYRLRGTQPGFLIVDYLQLIAPKNKDVRVGIEAVIAAIRNLTFDGWGALVISATNRDSTKSNNGLASFRDTSSIEYSGDSCYLLKDEGPIVGEAKHVRKIKLNHVKNRHGEMTDLTLKFDASCMSFSVIQEKNQPEVSPRARQEDAGLPDFIASAEESYQASRNCNSRTQRRTSNGQ